MREGRELDRGLVMEVQEDDDDVQNGRMAGRGSYLPEPIVAWASGVYSPKNRPSSQSFQKQSALADQLPVSWFVASRKRGQSS